jgi:predicted DNA binding CopG/RHH family protein
VDRPLDPLAPYRDAHSERRKKLISIRLDEYLLELTREVARQHQMPYQAVIRQWIQEGLRRVLREAKDDPDPSPVYRDR